MSDFHEYSGLDIEILELYEAVRRRPAMYLGATDQHGLYALLRYAVWDMLRQYKVLGMPLSKLNIWLEQDGSATLATESPADTAPFWGLSAEEITRPIQHRDSGIIEHRDLFIVTALSERLHVTVRGPSPHWRSLLFEYGVLRGDELHTCAPDARSQIWLRFWPDFTLLEPVAFDLQEVQSRLRGYVEKYPALTLTVSDNRVPSV